MTGAIPTKPFRDETREMARLVATVCLIVVATTCRAEHAMSFRQLEYLVGELPEYPQRLTIGSGKLRYESHSNLSNPGSLGIGVFERALAEKEFEALASNFSPATFAALPDHRGQVLSGDRWKRIRLTVEDQTLDKLVGSK